MCWVGSKPHHGPLTATFSQTFGPEALVAARPGGRLWVADSSSGTVSTTLKFQGAGGDDKVALGRLVSLGRSMLLSWTRAEGEAGDASGGDAPAAIALLDLDSISVHQQWSLAPVVDVVRWSTSHVIFAHRGALSVLLLFDTPLQLLQGILSTSGPELPSRPPLLAACLGRALELREPLGGQASARDVLDCLRPLTDAVASLDGDAAAGGGGGQGDAVGASGVDADRVAPFKQWVAELEAQEADALRGGCDPALSLALSPLANFPV
ncbi:unnamed protein product, partial [Prorocentrum cordatum]